jgi:NAD(P)-dependent dehydrogenase (short-subunit alcohol dehydrogenase family)
MNLEREEAMQAFTGKTAIVTGATAGIGETTVRLLHERGANVVIAGRDGERARQIAAELDASGDRALAVTVDVTDPDAARAMVAATLERFGALDFAVNNAGITGPAATPVPDYDIDDWRSVIETDLSGVFYCMKHEIPAMLKGGGAIVNLSAGNGIVGVAGMSAYTAAKHGVLGLTRSAALEFADRGIRINAIGPGYVETPRMLQTPPEVLDMFREAHPMKRLANPSEVARLIAFLLSDEASFSTGSFYPVDGGYTAQ